MPGPRVKGKRSSAVQLRAAHVRPLQLYEDAIVQFFNYAPASGSSSTAAR